MSLFTTTTHFLLQLIIQLPLKPNLVTSCYLKLNCQPTKENSDSDDDVRLSSYALAALQEFYDQQRPSDDININHDPNMATFQEDWQLSQFWYDTQTANALAQEAIRAVGQEGKVGCISCPTIYRQLRSLKPESLSVKLFEYDRRFAIYQEDFIFYDYNQPQSVVSTDMQNYFDLIIADPPFLSEECLEKIAATVRGLSKDKIILCTGAIMEQLAMKLLDLHVCQFEPTHASNLGNEFKCYANYNLDDYIDKKMTY